MMGRKGTFLVLLCSMAMIFGMSGVSSGAVYTSDLKTPNVLLSSGGPTLDFELDLTTSGYVPGTQLTGARLFVFAYDDANPIFWDAFTFNETGTVLITSNYVPLVSGQAVLVAGWFDIPEIIGGTNVWDSIENDGKTFFRVAATNGDFIFKRTQLEGTTAPVPEPGTMMLLGSGLVGLAGWGRKKFRK